MDVMLWVFGSVFLILVAIFAGWLYAKSSENRHYLASLPRSRRILIGVVGQLLSFFAALGSLWVGTLTRNWNEPSISVLSGVLLFMVLFVGLQVASTLCLASIIAGSETSDDSKRS